MAQETLCKGLTLLKNKNKFTIAKLHYSADDAKDESWATDIKRTYTTDVWNQEMELDFTKASGRRVYPEFASDLHIGKLMSLPYKDIWRGWDFGYRHPACIWGQLDETENRLNILAELLGEEKVINKFAEQVLEISKTVFRGYSFKDAGDPAVKSRSDKSERTTADILRSYGIRIQFRPILVRDGINTIRNLLIPKPDGKVRLKVNEPCKILIDGFLGGYVRDEEDQPQKDGYYEHIFDALRYLVVILYSPKTCELFKPSRFYVRPRPTALVETGY